MAVLAGSRAAVAKSPGATVPRKRIALFDGRFASARTFAASARAGGAEVLESGGDTLSLSGLAGQGTLSGMVGLTTYAEMLAVADLAARDRLSFGAQIAHEIGGAGVEHRLATGTAGTLALLDAAGGQWPRASWAIVSGANDIPVSRVAPVSGLERRVTLWSWAIA